MQNIRMLQQQVNSLISQAKHDIYTISVTSDPTAKQLRLQRLWDALTSIQFLNELLASHAISSISASSNGPAQPTMPASQPLPAPAAYPELTLPNQTFTIQELSNYDGKNGRPAYVAVGGVVYDVTNNRAWAAATHFGLVSGKDYTQEFASCHAGQKSILATLPVIGRLV
ncbi:cytochrome b5 domain-containing protein [Cytobacillus oceanisediminis]|uniref:cytochrome b5 domain-containing protein n=1 Tax=Cytobacillus oceanisediminis TaxID=665099 RepID=UPI001FB2EC07|nr:cytochrome b5 domain-containing protein [Cytobacillus oceanisediminis]UOE57652.1 cytochrome b5 [Cytobacillus oceanisediminis]